MAVLPVVTIKWIYIIITPDCLNVLNNDVNIITYLLGPSKTTIILESEQENYIKYTPINFLLMTLLDHPLTASNQTFLKRDSLIFTEEVDYNYTCT